MGFALRLWARAQVTFSMKCDAQRASCDAFHLLPLPNSTTPPPSPIVSPADREIVLKVNTQPTQLKAQSPNPAGWRVCSGLLVG